MYVGPWQEYKLAQVLQYYRNVEKEYEKLKRRDRSQRPVSSKSQVTNASGVSVPSRSSAPARFHPDPSPVLPPLAAYRNTQLLNKPVPPALPRKPPLPKPGARSLGKSGGTHLTRPDHSSRQTQMRELYLRGAAAEGGGAPPRTPPRSGGGPAGGALPARLAPISQSSLSPPSKGGGASPASGVAGLLSLQHGLSGVAGDGSFTPPVPLSTPPPKVGVAPLPTPLGMTEGVGGSPTETEGLGGEGGPLTGGGVEGGREGERGEGENGGNEVPDEKELEGLLAWTATLPDTVD